MNIGSQRRKGTGRTYGIKAKKLAEQGCNNNVAIKNIGNDLSIKAYYRKYCRSNNRDTNEENHDIVFLKNAMGCPVAFELERGAGARANLLAKTSLNRSKLLDAAATRVTLQSDISRWILWNRRKTLMEKSKEVKNRKRKIEDLGLDCKDSFYFMKNNLGISHNHALENSSEEEEDYIPDEERWM